MTVHGGATRPTPPLPRSIWVVAWASLAGQLIVLLQRGGRSGDGLGIALSAAFGALLVGWVAAGVVRARTVRLVLAWVVLVLVTFAELLSLPFVDDIDEGALRLLSLATSVVSLAGLWSFRGTAWYAWQRTRPPTREGAPIVPLVAVGAVVGVLGGVIGPVDDGIDVSVDVSDRVPRGPVVTSAARG